MIDSINAFETLQLLGVDFFTGVPDSLLKNFCTALQKQLPPDRHYLAANEGNAIALACGYYLATGQIPLVYMQNSGLGNAVNPLASLAGVGVYRIPMLLLIGWRGEPGVKDEPQHVVQGRITLEILRSLGIHFDILPNEPVELPTFFANMVRTARESSAPVAMLVRKNTFTDSPMPGEKTPFPMLRQEALQAILAKLETSDVVVATTGKTSRELYELRIARNEDPGRDFLNVGAMGHAMQIAIGIALAKPDRHVFCLDGDGSLIMHMGGMAPLAGRPLPNFRHIVINNGAHESVGGHPTVGLKIDLPAIARGCGYKAASRVETLADLSEELETMRKAAGPSLCEVRVRCGSNSSLGRPEVSLDVRKASFMVHLEANHRVPL